MFRLSRGAGLCLLPLTLLPNIAGAQQTPDTSGDVIARIKDEGLNRSQVMQTLSYLTDVIGPRLTGSPNLKRANTWTCDTMTEWGLQNAHLEAWGPFGRGWELEKFSAQVTSPQNIPLTAYPKAWSPGLKGTKTGEVVYLDVKTLADLDKYKGRLKGAIVLTAPLRELKAHFEALGSRYTDEELQRLEEATSAAGRRPGAGGPGGGRRSGGAPGAAGTPVPGAPGTSGDPGVPVVPGGVPAGAPGGPGGDAFAERSATGGAGLAQDSVLSGRRRDSAGRSRYAGRRRHAVRTIGDGSATDPRQRLRAQPVTPRLQAAMSRCPAQRPQLHRLEMEPFPLGHPRPLAQSLRLPRNPDRLPAQLRPSEQRDGSERQARLACPHGTRTRPHRAADRGGCRAVQPYGAHDTARRKTKNGR